MKKFIYIFFAVSILSVSCTKEEGCTDSFATNFNIDAENDDGSCEFGVAGGSWITQSIATNGSMSVTFGGFPVLDSTINYTETNPDSLDPYKLTMTENGMYTQEDVANNPVEGGTWSVSGNQLTLNTPDTILVLTVNSIDRDNISLSLNLIESTSEMGMEIDYNITQTVNSIREW
ncbi:MAG: hypothetical protein ACJ0QC_06075 [Flavobacteriales bacterium]|mgnify:FL=1|nr:MAG: hypothetical protein CBD88_01780 [Flavobacteriales bacterium TMED228]|tara:strand:- start:626 stop:1150 length:525 start_codon:yes stop_codon:yes gene_type:complete